MQNSQRRGEGREAAKRTAQKEERHETQDAKKANEETEGADRGSRLQAGELVGPGRGQDIHDYREQRVRKEEGDLMLTEAAMERKLREYASTFNRHVREKEWGKAHNIYNMVLTAAVMSEMSEKFRAELFGSYDGEDYPVDDGLIRRSDVQKVNTECCIRRNMAYEDIECRKMGLPLETFRYYSEADYCAGCKKAKR